MKQKKKTEINKPINSRYFSGTVQILTNDVQVLILCLSYCIITVIDGLLESPKRPNNNDLLRVTVLINGKS